MAKHIKPFFKKTLKWMDVNAPTNPYLRHAQAQFLLMVYDGQNLWLWSLLEARLNVLSLTNHFTKKKHHHHTMTDLLKIESLETSE